MNISTKIFLLGMATGLFSACEPLVNAPEPILPIPEAKQVEWQKMETYAFVHFGLNTFTDREWGYGNSNPKTFNPTKLDCEQWAQTFVNAGMKGVILTAKHHDGFCLWPTQLTEYCIRNTPYKDGKGDVVGELSKACKKYGLKFAVYLSPWDRHQANYGTSEYVDYFHKQLCELMSSYGEVFEVWFDGANGGDGWYGGANDSRTIDRRHYYNYPKIYEMLNRLQPQAVVFSDGGPGCRWVGNESGFAGATNWSFLRAGEVYPGYPKYRELQYGHADGNQWTAAECDVSLRPGWFYHPEEDGKVKSVDRLVDLYYRSVGHNATLLLNFPVDRNGLVHSADSIHAVGLHKEIEKQLSHNLLSGITPQVSAERGGAFKGSAMTDGNYDTYWSTPDGVVSADVVFTLQRVQKVNRMMLQEYIPLGQRVKSFVVEYAQGDQWLPVALSEETTTIGYKRLLRFDTVETDQLRVRFLEARGPLTINNIAAYYTDSTLGFNQEPNQLPQGRNYTVVGLSSDEYKKMTDRDAATSASVPTDELIIDLGNEQTIRAFHYLPNQSEYNLGMIKNYEISVGTDLQSIHRVVKKGEFSNIQNNPVLQSVFFTPVNARYVKLKPVKMIKRGEIMHFAEVVIQ